MRTIFLLLFILVSAPALASDVFVAKGGARLVVQEWASPLTGDYTRATLIERGGKATPCNWATLGDDDMWMQCGWHMELFATGPKGFSYDGRWFAPLK